MRIVAPSILSADFGNLERDIKMIDRSEAEWVHIDVMDGVFVPNISFGFPVMKPVRKATNKVLDVHLMIVEPEKYVKRFVRREPTTLPSTTRRVPTLALQLPRLRRREQRLA